MISERYMNCHHFRKMIIRMTDSCLGHIMIGAEMVGEQDGQIPDFR